MSTRYPRRGYADGPFGQVHFQSLGEGPAVVLLHQAPMSSGQYDNVYAPLAAHGFQAIGVDMPGFGMSDPVGEVPKVEDFAGAIPPVLKALGLDKAAIIGHHTGAMVASEVSLQFPDLVSAVVLNGPFPLNDAEREDYLGNATPTEKALTAVSGGGHLAHVFSTRERLADGTVPLERISNYVIQAFMGRGEYWHGHHAAFQYRQDLAIPKMTHRTLILTNTGDMIYEHAQRARAMRPDFDYVELEGGGVDIVDQSPQAWADAVASFLKA